MSGVTPTPPTAGPSLELVAVDPRRKQSGSITALPFVPPSPPPVPPMATPPRGPLPGRISRSSHAEGKRRVAFGEPQVVPPANATAKSVELIAMGGGSPIQITEVSHLVTVSPLPRTQVSPPQRSSSPPAATSAPAAPVPTPAPVPAAALGSRPTAAIDDGERKTRAAVSFSGPSPAPASSAKSFQARGGGLGNVQAAVPLPAPSQLQAPSSATTFQALGGGIGRSATGASRPPAPARSTSRSASDKSYAEAAVSALSPLATVTLGFLGMIGRAIPKATEAKDERKNTPIPVVPSKVVIPPFPKLNIPLTNVPACPSKAKTVESYYACLFNSGGRTLFIQPHPDQRFVKAAIKRMTSVPLRDLCHHWFSLITQFQCDHDVMVGADKDYDMMFKTRVWEDFARLFDLKKFNDTFTAIGKPQRFHHFLSICSAPFLETAHAIFDKDKFSIFDKEGGFSRLVVPPNSLEYQKLDVGQRAITITRSVYGAYVQLKKGPRSNDLVIEQTITIPLDELDSGKFTDKTKITDTIRILGQY